MLKKMFVYIQKPLDVKRVKQLTIVQKYFILIELSNIYLQTEYRFCLKSIKISLLRP